MKQYKLTVGDSTPFRTADAVEINLRDGGTMWEIDSDEPVDDQYLYDTAKDALDMAEVILRQEFPLADVIRTENRISLSGCNELPADIETVVETAVQAEGGWKLVNYFEDLYVDEASVYQTKEDALRDLVDSDPKNTLRIGDLVLVRLELDN